MHKLNQRKSYRAFVNQRDLFLEQVLLNAQLKITDLTNAAFSQAILLAYRSYPNVLKAFNRKREIRNLDQEIERAFEGLSGDIAQEILQLRRKVYLFTIASEHRAIQDQLGLNTSPRVDQLDINQAVIRNFAGDVNPVHKIDHELSKVRRSFMAKFELALIQDRPINEAMGMLYLSLPSRKKKTNRTPLKRIKTTEAGFKKKSAFGFVDDTEINDGPESVSGFNLNLAANGEVKARDWVFDQDTWNALIQDYETTYIPIDRGPNNIVDMTDPRTGDLFARENYESDEVYGWQIERDVTHDFVQQVRSGQMQTANENGIDEFIVIAILDDKVCDSCCDDYGCADFDGKLTSEIEEMTKGDYSAPPYHFNCRCALAPVSKDIGFIDETDSKREFDEWLNDETRVSTTR